MQHSMLLILFFLLIVLLPWGNFLAFVLSYTNNNNRKTWTVRAVLMAYYQSSVSFSGVGTVCTSL